MGKLEDKLILIANLLILGIVIKVYTEILKDKRIASIGK